MTTVVKETRRMRRILIFTALTLVATTAPTATPASQAPEPAPGPPVTIAVVRDGPTPARDTAALVESELMELMPGTAIRFVSSPEFDAGWKAGLDGVLEQETLGERVERRDGCRVELGQGVAMVFGLGVIVVVLNVGVYAWAAARRRSAGRREHEGGS